MNFAMGWCWIIGIIIIIAIVWGIVRTPGQNNNINNTANQKTALDILNERYARGEIDKDEYGIKKRDLDK